MKKVAIVLSGLFLAAASQAAIIASQSFEVSEGFVEDAPIAGTLGYTGSSDLILNTRGGNAISTIFGTTHGDVESSGTSTESIGRVVDIVAPASDNLITIQVAGRYRSDTGNVTTFALGTAGSEVIQFGSGGELVRGTGITSFTAVAPVNSDNNLLAVSSGGHVFFDVRLEYNDVTNVGFIEAYNLNTSPAEGFETIGTFTGNFDNSSLDELFIQSSGNADRTLAFDVVSTVAVPEPATLGLLGLAFGGLVMMRRRRK